MNFRPINLSVESNKCAVAPLRQLFFLAVSAPPDVTAFIDASPSALLADFRRHCDKLADIKTLALYALNNKFLMWLFHKRIITLAGPLRLENDSVKEIKQFSRIST